MRLTAAIAAVLISGSMALAQKIKDPVVHARPTTGVSASNTVAPVPVTNSSAAQLAKIEQQTARVRSAKPVAHNSGSLAATPALALGKNKPVRSTRLPRPSNPNNH